MISFIVFLLFDFRFSFSPLICLGVVRLNLIAGLGGG